jgi:hypothetical protein
VFDQPYNRNITNKKRLDNWLNWKQALGIEDPKDQLLKAAQYFNHGSPNSIDIDRFYIVETMPSLDDCYFLCKVHKNKGIVLNKKGTEEDRNIVALEKGVIKYCFKGTPDQCNNGLFFTFHLHKQDFTPNPIRKLLI